MNWDMFDRFEETINKYMPRIGEGKTMASQATTAVNRLVFKWYNNGDTYEARCKVPVGANDISDCANWIYAHIDGARHILDGVFSVRDEEDYEELLYTLATFVINNSKLEELNRHAKVGSIYDCEGKFSLEMPDFDD